MADQAERVEAAGAEAPDGARPDATAGEGTAGTPGVDGEAERAAAKAAESRAAEQMERRFRERFAQLQKEAEAGLPHAMHLVGIAYARGRGVEQDYAKAVEYFRRAAALGHLEAQVSLGYCYATGKGVPRDLGRAYILLREAADLGNRDAFELAERVAQRLHVEQLRRCDAALRRRRILRRLQRERDGGDASRCGDAAYGVIEIDDRDAGEAPRAQADADAAS